ncbi:hemin uptake protein HemP [Lysobacter aestuarii]|uniref:Hemin uptake protein HemP n=1 Tax=Marilutibacter aestuarii TaxID=1706195 RepID=A0A508AIT9_9GAMM|nr:hemin uptake protein HemP [Lysobacter aestuarii]
MRHSIAASSVAVQFPPRAVERRASLKPGAVGMPAAPVPRGALLDSDALLRGGREVLIQHGGEVYRLRHTRNDKLILTK